MAVAHLNELDFKRIVELPSSHCVFCTVQEKSTGRTQLFLIFEQQKRIYKRNGLRGTWHEMTDDEQSFNVRQQFDQCIEEKRVPCYTT